LWSEIASYAGTNVVMSPEAMEISRAGSPNERITLRTTDPLGTTATRFLRVQVTSP
jgi:hypothetical protein